MSISVSSYQETSYQGVTLNTTSATEAGDTSQTTGNQTSQAVSTDTVGISDEAMRFYPKKRKPKKPQKRKQPPLRKSRERGLPLPPAHPPAAPKRPLKT